MHPVKMKIEVWTDIMCPYCYIGKLNYEKALEQFQYKDQVELEWKAFQLNPDLPDKGKGIPVMEYLHNTVGISEENTEKMNEQIGELAKECGIKSNLELTTIALFQDANPRSAVAVFELGEGGVVDLQTKIKMRKTANVTVVAKGKDGKLYSVVQKVEVSIGGCGG